MGAGDGSFGRPPSDAAAIRWLVEPVAALIGLAAAAVGVCALAVGQRLA